MRTWLKEIRLNKKMSQLKIANEVEISRAFYTQIELGNRDPSVRIAKRIAEVLDFDWTKFYE